MLTFSSSLGLPLTAGCCFGGPLLSQLCAAACGARQKAKGKRQKAKMIARHLPPRFGVDDWCCLIDFITSNFITSPLLLCCPSTSAFCLHSMPLVALLATRSFILLQSAAFLRLAGSGLCASARC